MENNVRSILNNEELVKWGGTLNEFLWICAGANRKILRQCPADYAKYAGIGGTILFTALMATLSGGYALFFVFNNLETAIAFGVFWGMLIFNLDRFIVNTMYSDGKVTISWREFYSGLPRIIMAIFLGIVISTPLEMKIFEDRIDSQVVKDNIERNNQTRRTARNGNKELIDRRNQLEEELRSIQARLNKAELELKDEGEGNALSGTAGHGPIWADKKAYTESIKKELADWNEAHKSELANIKDQLKTNETKTNDDIKNGIRENGFCVRYEAFSNLKKDSDQLYIVSLVVMLLFVIIETAPTFFKMMISSGPYDDILRAEMHRVRVLSDQRISDLNDIINTEVRISTEKNKERLEAEVLANKELMERIAKTQAELLQTAIDKWREEELAKINENPSAYIKTNNAS